MATSEFIQVHPTAIPATTEVDERIGSWKGGRVGCLQATRRLPKGVLGRAVLLPGGRYPKYGACATDIATMNL